MVLPGLEYQFPRLTLADDGDSLASITDITTDAIDLVDFSLVQDEM